MENTINTAIVAVEDSLEFYIKRYISINDKEWKKDVRNEINNLANILTCLYELKKKKEN